VGVTRGCPKF